jgi:16S rRNA (cytidine1402-2'-O)-methyltransferase
MLSVLGTPIGNLQDASPRLITALQAAKLVACEDTRRTGRLFQLLGVATPKLVALHGHNEAAQIPALLKRLQAGEALALLSDSGLPALSDPGARLIAAAHTAGFKVEVIGGPTALANAAAGSGLVGLEQPGLLFLGFPPRTAKARTEFWAQWGSLGLPLVLYESPNRLAALCASALESLGNRPARLARELTKLHESWHGPDLATLAALGELKGECVLVIGTRNEEQDMRVELPLSTPNSLKELAAVVAKQTGVSNQQAYKALVALKHS